MKLFDNKIRRDNTVWACDLSKERLSDSKLFNDFGNIDQKVIAAIENLPFQDQRFDFVIGSSILHHTKNLSSFLEEVHRVLKDEGLYIGLNEPYGNKIMKRIQESRFKGFNEIVRPIRVYEEEFFQNGFDPNIKIIKKLKHQKPSSIWLYFYYAIFKFLPKLLQENLGGNILIFSKKYKA